MSVPCEQGDMEMNFELIGCNVQGICLAEELLGFPGGLCSMWVVGKLRRKLKYCVFRSGTGF